MRSLLRDRAVGTRVSNSELFFDLVYVVAVTQLSTLLRENPSWHGALQGAVLLGMIWNVWVYTTWVTNWLDPERTPTRIMLLAMMAGSIVLAAGVTEAYGERGLWVGIAYAAMQILRSLYTVLATCSDRSLQRNYLRILSWCVLSGACAVAGGLVEGELRLVLFAAAVVVDIVGGILQFWTPWLGRTDTRDWTIDGPHFAERCQAFMLIALGESVVGIGAPLISAEHVDAAGIVGLVGAFVAVVTLFLLYFDRWAEAGTAAIARTDDPGKLAARAYHLVHPIMIGGIILIAAGNEEVLAPLLGGAEHEAPAAAIDWFCAGGAALFVLGHAVYVRMISGHLSITHLIALALLVVLALIAVPLQLTALAVGLATGAVLVLLLIAGASRAHAHAGPA